MTDYYKILGIEKTATQEEIKKAYRKLSIKFHPDKNNGDAFFENMFKQIQEAYETLGNTQSRNEYDRKSSNQSYFQNQKNNHSNFEPVIEYFSADRNLFYSGDEITFEWKTYNADLIEIKPFGVVNANGNKTFKLNNINRQFVTVELKATNTNISRYVSKQINLENKIFRDAKTQSTHRSGFSDTHQSSASYGTKEKIETETFWSAKGRLRRKDYLIRAILLAIPYGIVLAISENSYDEGMVIFSAILGIACWIILAIQAIKRLHDINMSGWWYLIFLIPYINLIFGLYVLFADGTKGPNNYGPDPKNR